MGIPSSSSGSTRPSLTRLASNPASACAGCPSLGLVVASALAVASSRSGIPLPYSVLSAWRVRTYERTSALSFADRRYFQAGILGFPSCRVRSNSSFDLPCVEGASKFAGLGPSRRYPSPWPCGPWHPLQYLTNIFFPLVGSPEPLSPKPSADMHKGEAARSRASDAIFLTRFMHPPSFIRPPFHQADYSATP